MSDFPEGPIDTEDLFGAPAAPARADEPTTDCTCFYRDSRALTACPIHSANRCQVPPDGWYCTRGAGHDGPCAAIAVPPSASPEPGVETRSTKKCGRCGRTIEHDFCRTCGPSAPREQMEMEDYDVCVPASPPSSPERERAHPAPWEVRDDILILDANENIVIEIVDVDLPTMKRIVTAVNAEAALRARLQKAAELLDRAEDAVRPGALRNEIQTWLAESRR